MGCNQVTTTTEPPQHALEQQHAMVPTMVPYTTRLAYTLQARPDLVSDDPTTRKVYPHPTLRLGGILARGPDDPTTRIVYRHPTLRLGGILARGTDDPTTRIMVYRHPTLRLGGILAQTT